MKHLILHRDFAWAALSRRIRKEQRNREAYSPTVSTYRWWARRSHALIGALIDRARAVLGPGIVVSDPMAGGGTVAVEAAFRGLRVYAQDINPWAAYGLETTLRPVEPALLEKAAKEFIECLVATSAQIYGTSSGEEVITQLHVRKCQCIKCAKTHFLFPTSLVALDRRITEKPKTGWFGCPACGYVYQAAWPKGSRQCAACRHVFDRLKSDARRIVRRIIKCPHCKAKTTLEATDLRNGGWFPALTITSDGKKMLIRQPDFGMRFAGSSELATRLAMPIPSRGETAALVQGGFTNWSDLFPDRQLAVMDKALSALSGAAMPTPIRQRLLLAVAGFAEMAGYACRWDPKYRKVYEVTANHHYSRILLAAETNPMACLGRGTLPHRLDSAVEAVRWFPGSAKAKVTCGSSETQPPPNRSVDLVITDPPYYDSIQYAELSRLFRTFSAGLGLVWSGDPEKGEAVASRTLGCTHEEYIRRLESIFRETRRTLKPNGRMLLTFHHTRTKAWEAVAQSLRNANWRIVSVAVVHSENEKDFAKYERNVIAVDAVFECMRSCDVSQQRIVTALGPKNEVSRNVLAMGHSVATYVNGSSSPLQVLYFRQIKRRGIKKALFR
jgi:putative DNA methylase